MTYVADLHLHSPFAVGASKDLTFENLARWARTKGIALLASADFTHPRWFEETRRALRECGDGLFEHRGTRFILGTEVSCNSRQGGRSRRVHLLALAPSLDAVARINSALAALGSLEGDGRPTLHVSPEELVSLLMEQDERCLVIPAHLWTPWFGLYGSKSGFDSLEEGFGDMARYVHAVETGLSSEPSMNWRVPSLDGVSIVSFSDAHSLPKLGREATVFNGELSYAGLSRALREQDIAYTVEFFPEAGKYHYSGHRRCRVSLSPQEVARSGSRCPKCGRPMTLGVLQRVEDLGAREPRAWTDAEGFTRGDSGRPPFRMLVPLQQVLSESLAVGAGTKRAQREYHKLVERFGGEMTVLTTAPETEIAAVAGERTAEAIARVRKGDVSIEPGYDGVYGTVKIWPEEGQTCA